MLKIFILSAHDRNGNSRRAFVVVDTICGDVVDVVTEDDVRWSDGTYLNTPIVSMSFRLTRDDYQETTSRGRIEWLRAQKP